MAALFLPAPFPWVLNAGTGHFWCPLCHYHITFSTDISSVPALTSACRAGNWWLLHTAHPWSALLLKICCSYVWKSQPDSCDWMYSVTGATVWAIFNLFLSVGSFGGWDSPCCSLVCVLQFALIHVVMLKLQLPAVLPLHAEQVFDNIWCLRDQTQHLFGWNHYCPFLVVFSNIKMMCVSLQEFPATLPNR